MPDDAILDFIPLFVIPYKEGRSQSSISCACLSKASETYWGETKLFFSNSVVLNCTLVHVYELLDSKRSFMKAMKGKLLVIIIQSSCFVVTARVKVLNALFA